MEEIQNTNFSVSVYGNLTPYNDVISKARVRIFYKGLNRNRTYITDEFAEKLLSTISYSPICGIFSEDDDDFTDHGSNRETAKAYGVVPENPNITWENHLDPDGVERTYACADVLLWTARYKAASKIPGSAHSMELFHNSIKGYWDTIDGTKCYVFTDASFIGLTPLGKDVEPCFEGSAFYTLTDSINELVNELKNYNLITDELKGGETQMINFKMSDSQKYCTIWNHVNPNYNEEGGWMIEYGVSDVYDDYALVYNYETSEHFRLYFTKEEDTITFGEMIRVYIVDVTETELVSLNAIKALNNDTYENCEVMVNEKVEAVNTLTEEVNTLSNDNAEKDVTINTLTEDNAELNSTIEGLNSTVSTLEATIEEKNGEVEVLAAEVNSLSEYKKNVETEQKKLVVAKYKDKLDETVIEQYSNALETYSIVDLDKELAYKLVETNPSIFGKTGTPYISTESVDDSALSPAARILKRRRNKNSDNGGNE